MAITLIEQTVKEDIEAELLRDDWSLIKRAFKILCHSSNTEGKKEPIGLYCSETEGAND